MAFALKKKASPTDPRIVKFRLIPAGDGRVSSRSGGITLRRRRVKPSRPCMIPFPARAFDKVASFQLSRHAGGGEVGCRRGGAAAQPR